MKNSKEKSKIKILGMIMDAEINASDDPDMKLIRESAEKIEATEGKLTDAELESKLAAITGAQSKTVKTTPNRFKKRKLIISLIAAALAMVMVTAVAASPMIWGWLTFPFTRESGQLTEVPEGYIGIYTAEDFDKIRNAPDGNFILMSDIDLGGSEHAPIGDHLNPFDGKFNGNGHVISNFTITASGAAIWETVDSDEALARYEALKDKYNSGKYLIDAYNLPAYSIFGLDGRFDDSFYDTLRETYDMQYISAIGFFGNAGNATVTGLGFENATVTVTDADYCAVGVIAGQVGYISSCYVKNSTVTIDADTSDVEEYASSKKGVTDIFYYMDGYRGEDYTRQTIVYSVSAGLLCGEVFAVDSCYTDGVVNAFGTGSESIDYSTLSAGLIAGYGGSAVSSYSTATVNIEGNIFRSRGIFGKACLTPMLIPWKVLKSLINDHMEGDYFDFENAANRSKCRTIEKWDLFKLYGAPTEVEYLERATYADIREVEEIFFIDGDGTLTMDYFCKATPFATRFEKLEQQHGIDKIGDIPAIEQMYRDAGMRVGAICCYTPEGKENAKYYEGFDFTDVWTMKDGMPELKIFD